MTGYIETADTSRRALESIYDFLVGDYIGHGVARFVYENNQAPQSVIKLCNADVTQNILEYDAWQAVQETDLAQWFAPCVGISNDGRVLVQAKTVPAHKNQLPTKVPAFFTDLKPENWGWFEDRIVCHDYALHLMKEQGMSSRMKKSQWSPYE